MQKWHLAWIAITAVQVSTLLLCMGCGAIREIKFSGGYEGKTGEITLVLNEVESAIEGAPVLDKIAEGNTGGREKLYTFTADEIKTLRDKLLSIKTAVADVGAQAFIKATAKTDYGELRALLRPPVSPTQGGK